MRRSTTKWLIAVIALVLVFGAVVPTVAQASGGGTTLISGKDGKDGQDGADGITPILRINEETGEWEYSYTGGRYWTSMGVKAGSSYDADNLLNPEYINQAWYANFGDKGGGAVIWEEKTLTFTSADNYFGLNNQKFNLTVGIKVDVVWNGTVYTCIPFEQSGEIFLGNRELMVPGGSHAAVYNVPFCFTGMRDTFNMVKKSTDTAENITVKIVTHVYDTYNKLDVGYLPDEVVTTDELPALGGGTSLDVTAQPGQTIIVKEVDENGKPTKWESAEYQEKICGKEVKLIYPEQNCVFNEDFEAFIAQGDTSLTVGNTYIVNYNGVDYTEKCVSVSTPDGFLVGLGNFDAMFETGDNGVPFLIIDGSVMEMSGMVGVIPIDGSESITLSIKAETFTQIPQDFWATALPYYIDVVDVAVQGSRQSITCNETVDNVRRAINSGRTVILRIDYTNYNDVEMTEVGGTHLSYSALVRRTKDYSVLVFNDHGTNISLFAQEDGTFAIVE